jgi:transposase InsO family protein
MSVFPALFLFLRDLCTPRAALLAENLALRQQLAVLRRSVPKPRLRGRDRLFWVVLSRLWAGWADTLHIVEPQTVIRWQRQGFRGYWRWKSRRSKPGRPSIARKVRDLIRRLSRENPMWGVPRIKSELALLGHEVAESTVAKYVVRHRTPPSQTWRTFLKNHAADIVACDFFTVPTVAFRQLYVFVMLRHSDRRILHINITINPTAAWTRQQIVEAFPYDEAPKYLLHDRASVFNDDFRRTLKHLGITDVRTAYRSPWQNPYCERVIGSIRRECTHHLIVLGQRHLLARLEEYVRYYNGTRPHLSLNRNSPQPHEPDPPANGRVVSTPVLGGLHHEYHRVA